MNKKLSVKALLWNCIFLALVFLMFDYYTWTSSSLFQTFWQHIDELILLGLFAYTVLNIRILINKDFLLLIVWVFFLAIGGISSAIYGYQSIVPTFSDFFFVVNRFMVGYWALVIYCDKKKCNISQALLPVAKFVVLLLFVLAVHDIFMTPFFPKGDFRYVTETIMLMYQHQTFLSSAGIALLIFLGYCNKKNDLLAYMLMISFVVLMAFRGKGVAFLVVYWGIYICVLIFKDVKLLPLVTVGGILAVFAGFKQFMTYYGNNSQPRAIMFRDSIQLMLEHFPFGTGYATYGSIMATNYYSVLYRKLGYNNYYGLSETYSSYLTDGFWPAVLGQFGFVGTILFLFVVGIYIKKSVDVFVINRRKGVAMLAIMIYMIIISLAETSFFGPVSLLYFMLFGIFEKEIEGDET